MFNKELLIKIMEEKNFSAYKLAKESHVAQSTLSTILTGNNKNPSSNTLTKIANTLGVSINNFFETETNSTNKSKEIIEDKDLALIERARNKMSTKEKERMMNLLKAGFDIFDELEDDEDDDI